MLRYAGVRDKQLRRRRRVESTVFKAPNQGGERSFGYWIARSRLAQQECFSQTPVCLREASVGYVHYTLHVAPHHAASRHIASGRVLSCCVCRAARGDATSYPLAVASTPRRCVCRVCTYKRRDAYHTMKGGRPRKKDMQHTFAYARPGAPACCAPPCA